MTAQPPQMDPFGAHFGTLWASIVPPGCASWVSGSTFSRFWWPFGLILGPSCIPKVCLFVRAHRNFSVFASEAHRGPIWDTFFHFFVKKTFFWVCFYRVLFFDGVRLAPGPAPHLSTHDYTAEGHRNPRIPENRKRGSRGLILPPFGSLFRDIFLFFAFF